jgi:HK97 family phage portal protein
MSTDYGTIDYARRHRERVQDSLGPQTRKEVAAPAHYISVGTTAGVFVSEEKALNVSAVFSAVKMLSEDIASLPLHLYFRDGDVRRRAEWRPEYRLLNHRPNWYQTAFDLRESLMASLLLRGQAFCEIERNVQGQPIALHFIEPTRVEVKQDLRSRRLYFSVNQAGRLEWEDVFYLHAFSTDGIHGRGVVAQARESIGLSAATERFGADYFGNGANPGGVLRYEKKLDQDQVARLRESWNERHQGRAGGVAVLEDGMDYKQIGIPPEDSQFLETRKFQVTEIARWFRIPPHKLGDLERATFSNIEEQSMEYVRDTLRPWLVRIEQAARQQLLPEAAADSYYFEHLTDAVLRGDIKTRYEAYAIGRQNGWLSANEIRKRENMNPIADGDQYLLPLNMVEAGQEETDG